MVKKQMSETKKENRVLKTIQKGVARVYSLGDKITAFVWGAMLTMMARGQVYAETEVKDGQGLFDTARDWIGNLLLVPAVFFFIMGLVNYASAHSEGDGPAQKKAWGQIIGGVLIAAVSILMKTLKITVPTS